MEKIMFKLVATFAIAAATLATPALARNPGAKTVAVRTADLDLSSPAGRAALHRRIASATETVCGSYGSANRDEADEISRCRVKVRDQVTTQVAALADRTRIASR
jgi:UrcA family protein